jgi:hypothetical protein
MGFLKEVRARGSRFPLELDSNGSPCGKWASQFISYLGVCVRAHAPITMKTWRHVNDQLKANMWDDVKVTLSMSFFSCVILYLYFYVVS